MIKFMKAKISNYKRDLSFIHKMMINHQFHFCTVIHPALIMFSKALNMLILKIMHKRLINYREKIFFQRNKIIKKIENLYV